VEVADKPAEEDKSEVAEKPVEADKPAEEDKTNESDKSTEEDKTSVSNKPAEEDKSDEEDKPMEEDKPVVAEKPMVVTVEDKANKDKGFVVEKSVRLSRPGRLQRVYVRPVLVSQEQFEQGADDTEEALPELVVTQELAPLKRVEQPRKVLAPTIQKSRFNVLLRTAAGFDEKAGYSVSG